MLSKAAWGMATLTVFGLGSGQAIAAPGAPVRDLQTTDFVVAAEFVVPTASLETKTHSVPLSTSAIAPRPSAVSVPILVPPPETLPAAAPLAGSGEFDLPAPSPKAQSRTQSLWATYYNVHRAQNIANGEPLRTLNGRSLGVQLTQRDWCAAAVQGTVQVMNSQRVLGTYNYAGRGPAQVDCSRYYPSLGKATGQVRFTPTRNPFGDGVQGLALVPYRTIAVDPSQIPIGSVLYIPAARGQMVTLPSGARVAHDGYFYAADVGGAIKGRHIDVFLGTADRNPFPFVKSTASGSFAAYLVSDPQIRQTLAGLHRSTSRTAQR